MGTRSWLAAFEEWQTADSYSDQRLLEKSSNHFSIAADSFFDLSSSYSKISRALIEYSTLMDAFAKIQRARTLMTKSNYDESLQLLSTASEILRSSIHFGYLAPYVSACATFEAASEIDFRDIEAFESFRNAIALLEQSKIALNLRDDKHPMMVRIDTMLKLSISKALRAEGESLDAKGEKESAERKYAQHIVVNNEYVELAALAQIDPNVVNYFPVDDFRRALNAGFVTSYPDSENLCLMNIGSDPAESIKLGNQGISDKLEPGDSILIHLKTLPKGRLRVIYLSKGAKYDDGCISLI